MIADFTREDAEFLIGRPEFRRFLFAAIQAAGVLGQTSPANGPIGRDLAEGRRSLGLDLLAMADAGQPDPMRSPQALATLDQIIREAMTPKPKDKTRDRRNHSDRDDDADERYAGLTD